jgi:hypothetical protein
MKRLIYQALIEWSASLGRRPILLRGARQVGKTHAVRHLGEQFEHFVEINFERSPKYRAFFQEDLDPKRIVEILQLETGTPIIPGKTLLFFDEIQVCPEVIIALRYFYEELADLHVIAAGSLLDFAIEKMGVPVGRVSFLYLYPLSFIEFLAAAGHMQLAQYILQKGPEEPAPELIHKKLLKLLGEYMLTGGMPKAVSQWITQRSLEACSETHQTIVASYQQDFDKYCKKHEIKYAQLIFNKVPALICQVFKFSHLETPYQKRELEPCLELLMKANVIHKVSYTAAQGTPLGATIDFSKFKLLFVDIALCQTLLGITEKNWIIDPLQTFVNKGALCEALVGQELLAYSPCDMKTDLYYWQRANRGSQAEVDYVIADKNRIIPIEVKGGKGSTLRSLHVFLESHPQITHGVRFSIQNYSIYDAVRSYPLYAVAALFSENKMLQAFCKE